MNNNKTYGIIATIVTVGMLSIVFGVELPRRGWDHVIHMIPMYSIIAAGFYSVIGLFWSVGALFEDVRNDTPK